jgi:DNA-directed RNA polymerase specialized sigma24 family protein
MRAGDREAAAVFITRYGSRIRRRIRGKLSPAMRRIYDSQEILSTVGRRLDLYVRSGKLEAASEEGLWALVFRMASNAVVDKSRVFRRLREVEGEDSRIAREFIDRLQAAERQGAEGAEFEIERVIGMLEDNVDQQILTLWLAGAEQAVIAEQIGRSANAVSKRWAKIRSILQQYFAEESRR